MDSVTRQRVRQQRSDKKTVARQARSTKRAKLRAKQDALKNVLQAAKEAAGRVPMGAWVYDGQVVKACNHTGPHHGIWCIFHGRRRVTLVKVPGARGGCQVSHPDDEPNQELKDHLSIWLGSDGRLYRVGHHGEVFRAKLMDRKTAADIMALVPKLNAMAIE